MTAAAPTFAATVAGLPKAHGARVRARTWFAIGYTLIVLVEAAVYYSGTTSTVMRHTPGQLLLSAGIDGAAWWLCIALAERGFRLRVVRPLPYVAATIAATIIATWLHLLTETWYFAPRPDLNEGRAYTTLWMLHLYGLWRAAAVTIVYYFRLRFVADTAALHAARVEQAALARRAVEANLRALQGRVDPRLLFETLAEVERLCEAEPARADRMLDALIAYLRAALPEADAPARTLADELALVDAYVALVRARCAGEVALVVDADSAARAAALPPMLLLPLVEHLCAGGADRRMPLVLAIAGLVDGERLRIVVTARGRRAGVAAADDRLAFVRQQLAELFGDAAALAVQEDGNADTRITLEVPNECA